VRNFKFLPFFAGPIKILIFLNFKFKDTSPDANSIINLPQSIELLSNAWKCVSPSTMEYSFKKCGFFKAKHHQQAGAETLFDFKLKDIPEFTEIINRYIKLLGKFNVKTNFTAYVEFDRNLVTSKQSPLEEQQCFLKDFNQVSFNNNNDLEKEVEEDDDDSLSEMESFEEEEEDDFEAEKDASNVKETPISVHGKSDDGNESDDSDLQMSRINMIRHIGDLKLFAAQRKSKEYGKRLLTTICLLEKQIFDEPKELNSKSCKK
jgi:hypothetical protein